MAVDPTKMTPDALLATAASSLECFGYAIMPGFECAPHHKLIVHKLEQLLRGKIRKLAIICPPRHGKSTIASILLPAYFLGRNPGSSVITASYGAELSEGWGRRVRNIISAPLYNSIFPVCRLSPDSQAMHRFDTTLGGAYIATGRGGPLTGRGANLLVLDDLLKDSEEARSEIVCKSIIDWLAHVAFTRLARDARVVAISTRWSERDPMGWIIREQQGWDVLHLPAVSEGGADPLARPLGAPLWESQFPLPALQSIRTAVGNQVWQCLYQGNPTASLGSVFRREWFRHYQQLPASFSKIIQSWDTAFKIGAANDFSVCTTWGVTDAAFYLLSMWRDRVEFPDLKKQVALQAEQWKPHAILVEDKASGQSLIQELKTATSFPVLPIKVDNDKETRASAVTAFFEAGKVLFPEGAPWLADLEDELASFPGAVHDDIVDSVSQALNYLRGTSGVLGWIEYLKNVALGLFQHPEPKEPSPRDELVGKLASLRFELKTRSIEPPTPGQFFRDVVRPPCPSCKAVCVQRIGSMWRCGQCGGQWWHDAAIRPGAPPSRDDLLSGRFCITTRRW
jgi:predicted phage terminase large subunit-like protein